MNPYSRDFDAETIAFLQKCKVAGESALDIGARYLESIGAGCFQGLSRFGVQLEQYMLLEVHEPNVAELREHAYTVQQGDVRDVRSIFPERTFDIVLWVHGPEHMKTFEEACSVLRVLRLLTNRFLVVSFPVGRAPQKAIRGNPHERHCYTIQAVEAIVGCFHAWDVVSAIQYPRAPYEAGSYMMRPRPNGVVVYQRRSTE